MRDRAREVVVTGTGVCCHMGDDWPAIESALREGRPRPSRGGRRRWRTGTQCEVIGIYPGDLAPERLGIDKAQARFMGRVALLALRAARLALAEAGVAPRDVAVVVGSGTGDVDTHREVAERLARTDGSRRVSPTVIPRLMASTVPANLATVLGATGPSFTAAAACAGGAYNLLLAAAARRERPRGRGDRRRCRRRRHPLPRGLRRDARLHHARQRPARARLAPVRGRPRRLRLLGGRGRRRARDRAGAEARGAAVLGVLLGYGMSSDGTGSMVAPSPEGAELAMRRALDHAGVRPEDVDYVNTHATSTPVGDVSEVRAMRKVLGGRHVAYSSTKGYTGHPVSAAGPDRGDLHAGDAARRLDRALRQRGAARPGAPRLPPGGAAGVAARCARRSQLVRLRRHERDAGAGRP